MPGEKPISSMALAERREALAEVQAELRAVSGKPWADELAELDADGARRQTLWRRLDQLVADGAVSESPPAPASPPENKARPPDLQELVARFGGYNKITPEAWAEYARRSESPSGSLI
jgi:hypothetical protein